MHEIQGRGHAGGAGEVPPVKLLPMVVNAKPDRDGLRYTVALIQIWGGLNGLWDFIRDLGRTGFVLPPTLVPGALIIGLVLAASVVAGVALWFDRRYGYALSVPVQLAQLVWYAGATLTFRIAASGWILADAFLRMKQGEETVTVGWQFDPVRPGTYALSLVPREEVSLSVNLVALAILIWLLRRLRSRPPGPQPA